MRAEENNKKRISELKELFKETQSLSQTQNLSEDEILREVEANRQDSDIESLRRIMDEISRNAQDKGLTPEILESLLVEIDKDEERADWMRFSLANLERAYGEDEPEY